MAIYDKNGNPISGAFDVAGETLGQVYDIEKNPLIDGKMSLKVMTYNAQWFTKINAQAAMQAAIINKYDADIIGFQEFSQDGIVPEVGQGVLTRYDDIRLSNHMNYLGIASKIDLYNVTSTDFVNQDPEDISRYGETRAYMKAYFDFNDKTICFINTHLAVITPSYIYAQMGELFDLAEDEEYVIITADFNTSFSSFSSETYLNTFKQFVDGGYNLANNSPAAGITNTFSSLTTAASLADLKTNPDSIITSANIDIKNRTFDTIKLDYLDGNPIDHIAVAANLLI